uniref:Uncharacterized protein n=1 Tax=Arundo donax TaxID=35708 RepID=A0A0A9ALA6_ARUDO
MDVKIFTFLLNHTIHLHIEFATVVGPYTDLMTMAVDY